MDTPNIQAALKIIADRVATKQLRPSEAATLYEIRMHLEQRPFMEDAGVANYLRAHPEDAETLCSLRPSSDDLPSENHEAPMLREIDKLRCQLDYANRLICDWWKPQTTSEAVHREYALGATKVKTQRHKYWYAGDPDCPPELKAGGEIHTLKCKVCGVKDARSPFCSGSGA